jgi:hypothetical protein
MSDDTNLQSQRRLVFLEEKNTQTVDKLTIAGL